MKSVRELYCFIWRKILTGFSIQMEGAQDGFCFLFILYTRTVKMFLMNCQVKLAGV